MFQLWIVFQVIILKYCFGLVELQVRHFLFFFRFVCESELMF